MKKILMLNQEHSISQKFLIFISFWVKSQFFSITDWMTMLKFVWCKNTMKFFLTMRCTRFDISSTWSIKMVPFLKMVSLCITSLWYDFRNLEKKSITKRKCIKHFFSKSYTDSLQFIILSLIPAELINLIEMYETLCQIL